MKNNTNNVKKVFVPSNDLYLYDKINRIDEKCSRAFGKVDYRLKAGAKGLFCSAACSLLLLTMVCDVNRRLTKLENAAKENNQED